MFSYFNKLYRRFVKLVYIFVRASRTRKRTNRLAQSTVVQNVGISTKKNEKSILKSCCYNFRYNIMAKFKGQLSFKVTFDGLNIPNDFDKWINEIKTQLNSFEKTYKRKNFEVKSINKVISINENKKEN